MKKEPDRITSLVLDWQENGEGLSEIITEASKIIIEYPRRKYRWSRDSCLDFYIVFYPKLLKLIGGFNYRGLSFKSLLNHTLAWQVNTYYKKQRFLEKMHHCVTYHCVIEAETASAAAEPETDGQVLDVPPWIRSYLGIGRNGEIKNCRLKRQLLMLALKNAYYLDDNYIKRISELTGCGELWLTEAVCSIRAKSSSRCARMAVYNERMNKAYMRLCQIHREYAYCTGPAHRRELYEEQKTLEKRIRRASAGKKNVSLNPTNNEIAEVMGLPKGSVDSGLYLLKKLLREIPLPGGG